MTIDILALGTIAGAIMAVLGLIAFLSKPILNFITKINKTFAEISEILSKVNYNQDLLARDLEASKSDRQAIRDELERQDERLNKHSEKLVEHSEKFKTLFNTIGGNK